MPEGSRGFPESPFRGQKSGPGDLEVIPRCPTDHPVLSTDAARPVCRPSYILCFALGLLLAVSLHYVLYRVGRPSKPFIYVAF
jgi:hypothetical protein